MARNATISCMIQGQVLLTHGVKRTHRKAYVVVGFEASAGGTCENMRWLKGILPRKNEESMIDPALVRRVIEYLSR